MTGESDDCVERVYTGNRVPGDQTMTAKTHLIENELKGEWLEAAPGE
jgi:hypothetical protein